MAGLTLEIAEEQLAQWLAANSAVTANQSYSIDNRTLTRADAGAIKDQIEFWDKKCKALDRTGGGPRVRFVAPV